MVYVFCIFVFCPLGVPRPLERPRLSRERGTGAFVGSLFFFLGGVGWVFEFMFVAFFWGRLGFSGGFRAFFSSSDFWTGFQVPQGLLVFLELVRGHISNVCVYCIHTYIYIYTDANTKHIHTYIYIYTHMHIHIRWRIIFVW